jgi:hypothetical protein
VRTKYHNGICAFQTGFSQRIVLSRPVHQLQCCPHYQIRVPVDKFNKSKKQEKVWKKVQDFLAAKPQNPHKGAAPPQKRSDDLEHLSENVSKLVQKSVMEAARQGHILFSDDLELESMNYSLRSKPRGDSIEFSSGICLNIASKIVQEQKKRQEKEISKVPELAADLGAVLVSILSSSDDQTVSKVVSSATGHLSWSISAPKAAPGTPFKKNTKNQASDAHQPPQNQLIVRHYHFDITFRVRRSLNRRSIVSRQLFIDHNLMERSLSFTSVIKPPHTMTMIKRRQDTSDS